MDFKYIFLNTLILILFTSSCQPYVGDYFLNPYEDINWQTVQYYDANLHTHTTLSDGSYDPHQAIDKYHELDYHILALTDHDFHHHDAHPQALYPWTELNDIYFMIKDRINPRYNEAYEGRANEEWQNRDPDELGMLAVEGSELSAGHHIGSYMSDYAGAESDEHTSLRDVGNRDGLAMFFHPGSNPERPWENLHATIWYFTFSITSENSLCGLYTAAFPASIKKNYNHLVGTTYH